MWIRSNLVAALAAMGLAFSASTSAADIQLKYGSYLPPSAVMSVGNRAMVDVINNDAELGIKYTVFDSGTLTSARAALTSLRDGIVNGNLAPADYYVSELPAYALLANLGLGMDNPWVLSAAISETASKDCEQCVQELAKYKTRHLWSYTTTPYHLICNMRESDVESLNGYRVRVSGSIPGDLSKAAGLIPDQMSNAEAYLALQQHKLDCFQGTIGWLRSLSLSEVTNVIYDSPLLPNVGMGNNMDLKTWNRLNDVQKKAILRASIYGVGVGIEKYFADDNEVLNHLDKYQMQVHRWPDESGKKLDEFKAQYLTGYLKPLASKRGVKDPDAIVNAFEKNVKKWTAIFEGKELDAEQYTDLVIENLPADF